MAQYLLYFAVALCTTLVATPFVKKLAEWWGAVDQPNHRKVHTRVMPRLGGLAIYIAFTLCFFLFVPLSREAWGIFIGGTIIMITGALDDRYQLSPRTKMAGQLLAAFVVIGFGLKVDFINLPFDGQVYFKWLSIPITIFWLVGVTNAINLIDGLDGLAAGVSGVAIMTTMIMSFMLGNTLALILSIILLGAVIGFLFFNFHPAKIFMGDTGALFLGFNLAALSILGFKQVTLIAFLIPILILGVPLSDTFFAIIRRVVNKKPISEADKNHLHHCLQAMGFSHRMTVVIIYGISAVFALSAVLFSQSTLWGAAIIIGIILILLELGSEIIGLVSKKKKPLLRIARIIKLRYRLASRSK